MRWSRVESMTLVRGKGRGGGRGGAKEEEEENDDEKEAYGVRSRRRNTESDFPWLILDLRERD